MADDETPETPAEQTPAEHAVPSEDAAEIAGSAEDAPLEAAQEAREHIGEDKPADEAEQFDPIAGNAVPTDDATEIAGSAEDAPLEAAQEAVERAEAEQLVEAYEEVVAEKIVEEIVEEIVAEAVEEAVAEEIVAEAIEEAVAEEIVAEAIEEAVAEEIVAEAIEEAVVEEIVAEAVEAELEAEAEEEIEEEPTLREKPAVPGAHLEVDIVPEGVDPLSRDTTAADPYASVAEAYEQEVEVSGAEGEPHEDEEALAEPISTAAIDLASGARYRATGKRKTAIARVTLRPGTGTYLVNGRVLEEHFPRVTLQRNIRQPLETVGYQDRMDVVARLHGGGISAQAGALRHGVSRALLEADPNLRGELKRRGFLTRDSRAKERKKAGLKKARKRPQFSKR
jgi:small subunit ribosomal protein S9